MTGRACVFLGPSLALAEARDILPDAAFLPPAQMGDVHAALAGGPAIVCLIDGVFDRVPAVWHKEILFALAQGVRVVGAASMGALRAAELHSCGMEGIGAVFEAFRDEALTADDEVAVIHGAAEDGYRPLSEALVNLRDGLRVAAVRGVVTRGEHDALVAAAQRTFYPERSWPRVFDDARALGVAPERVAALRALVEHTRPNVKRRDALAALHHVAATRHVPAGPVRCELEPTEFWHQLVATTARRRGDDDVRPDAADPAGAPGVPTDSTAAMVATAATAPTAAMVLDHARIALDDMRELRLRALLALLASGEAERAGLTVDDDQLAAAAERLRLRHGLASAERTRAFLADNDLSEPAFAEACRLEVVYDALIARAGRSHDAATLDELRRAGRYAALAETAATARRSLDARGLPRPSLADARLDEADLLAWYQASIRPIRGSLEAHAAERGFRDVPALLRALVRRYCSEPAAG